jgi:hypothetical protein
MLVHHPDSQTAGIERPPDLLRGPPDQNLTGIRPDQAKRHPHEGGFPCAILSEQGVDLPLFQNEIGPVESQHGAEVFGYSSKLENRSHSLTFR